MLTTVAVWSTKILNAFEAARADPDANTKEAVWHGAYNKLLNTVFPVDTDYTVEPQYITEGTGRDSTDFVFVVTMYLKRHPVFFLELKAPGKFALTSDRSRSDRQMRQRVLDWEKVLEIPELYGVSAYGTRLAFYKYTKAPRFLAPKRIPSDPDMFNDTAPEDWWSCELTEQEGFERFMAVVSRTRELCQERYGTD